MTWFVPFWWRSLWTPKKLAEWSLPRKNDENELGSGNEKEDNQCKTEFDNKDVETEDDGSRRAWKQSY